MAGEKPRRYLSFTDRQIRTQELKRGEGHTLRYGGRP